LKFLKRGFHHEKLIRISAIAALVIFTAPALPNRASTAHIRTTRHQCKAAPSTGTHRARRTLGELNRGETASWKANNAACARKNVHTRPTEN